MLRCISGVQLPDWDGCTGVSILVYGFFTFWCTGVTRCTGLQGIRCTGVFSFCGICLALVFGVQKEKSSIYYLFFLWRLDMLLKFSSKTQSL